MSSQINNDIRSYVINLEAFDLRDLRVNDWVHTNQAASRIPRDFCDALVTIEKNISITLDNVPTLSSPKKERKISKDYILNRAIGAEPTILYKSGTDLTNTNFREKIQNFIRMSGFKSVKDQCYYDEDDGFEFEIRVINDFTKSSYLNTCKEILKVKRKFSKDFVFWQEEKCSGGNHIQLDFPFKEQHYNERLLYNLHIDIINHPEILWLFNDPVDDCNACTIIKYEVLNSYTAFKGIHSDDVLKNFQKHLNFDTFKKTFIERDRLEDTKDICIGSKYDFKTMEFRFFDMWENLKEASFQYDFLMKWVEHNVKYTLRGRLRKPMYSTQDYWNPRVFNFKKSLKRSVKFMNLLGMKFNEKDHAKLIWNLQETFRYKSFC